MTRFSVGGRVSAGGGSVASSRTACPSRRSAARSATRVVFWDAALGLITCCGRGVKTTVGSARCATSIRPVHHGVTKDPRVTRPSSRDAVALDVNVRGLERDMERAGPSTRGASDEGRVSVSQFVDYPKFEGDPCSSTRLPHSLSRGVVEGERRGGCRTRHGERRRPCSQRRRRKEGASAHDRVGDSLRRSVDDSTTFAASGSTDSASSRAGKRCTRCISTASPPLRPCSLLRPLLRHLLSPTLVSSTSPSSSRDPQKLTPLERRPRKLWGGRRRRRTLPRRRWGPRSILDACCSWRAAIRESGSQKTDICQATTDTASCVVTSTARYLASCQPRQ